MCELATSNNNNIMRIEPRCTHRRVPGSRLVTCAGDAGVAVARCSLKILFFAMLLANRLGEEQTDRKRLCLFSKYGTVIS